MADEGKAFFEKMLDNVPAALFFLLPLMALALKLLYPLSKRFYVEHLLFVVHFHAFFFLMLILQIVLSRFFDVMSLSGTLSGVAIFASSLYIPVYLYKAMRRVYGQGHLITIPKYGLCWPRISPVFPLYFCLLRCWPLLLSSPGTGRLLAGPLKEEDT